MAFEDTQIYSTVRGVTGEYPTNILPHFSCGQDIVVQTSGSSSRHSIRRCCSPYASILFPTFPFSRFLSSAISRSPCPWSLWCSLLPMGGGDSASFSPTEDMRKGRWESVGSRKRQNLALKSQGAEKEFRHWKKGS